MSNENSVKPLPVKMKVKATTPYFGGKRTLAPDIVQQMGEHTQYFEPFCGSCAVLFNKKPSQKETICDLHGDATNLARVIQNESIAIRLYERTSRTPFAEGILHDARDFLQEPYDFESRDPEQMLERAYWFFIASWMGRNGSTGTKRIDYQIAVRFTNDGGSPSVRWKHAVESMPPWSKRLFNVVILTRDSFKIIPKFQDKKGTVIYIDPPYFPGSRTGYKKGGGEYLHEFKHGPGHRFKSVGEANVCEICGLPEKDHKCDHARLADLLNEFKNARIVLSYYDEPYIRELYQGWKIIEKPMKKRVSAQAKKEATVSDAPEILLINGPAFGKDRQSKLF